MQPNDSVTDLAEQVGSLLCRNGKVGHNRLQYPNTAWSNASAEVPELSNWLSLLVFILIRNVDIVNVFHCNCIPHNIEKLICHLRQTTSYTYKFIHMYFSYCRSYFPTLACISLLQEVTCRRIYVSMTTLGILFQWASTISLMESKIKSNGFWPRLFGLILK